MVEDVNDAVLPVTAQVGAEPGITTTMSVHAMPVAVAFRIVTAPQAVPAACGWWSGTGRADAGGGCQRIAADQQLCLDAVGAAGSPTRLKPFMNADQRAH